MLKELSDQLLLREVQQNKMNLIVLFTVGYSGNCLLTEFTLEEVIYGLSDNVVVYKLVANNNPKAVLDYGVREYPTILFFKNGLVVDFHTGVISKKELYKKVLKFIKSNKESISINS
jgi:thioredoxin 1